VLAQAVVGAAFVAAIFLVLGGIAKVRKPENASMVLAYANLPSNWLLVRGMGYAEILAGAACIVGWRPAWFIGSAAYLGFSIFLGFLMANDLADKGCGCLGVSSEGSRVDHLHLILNIVAMASLGLAGWAQVGPSWHVLHTLGAFAIPLLLSVSLCVYLVYLGVSLLPRLTTPRDLVKGGALANEPSLNQIGIARSDG